MIGRDGPVNRFETLRWARAQADDPRMTPLASHLLLALASFCDEQASCHPSVATLAKATKRDRASVHRALRLLEDLQLVWSRQGGRGKSATRELLFNPARDSLTEPALRGDAPAVARARQQDAGPQRGSSRTSAALLSHQCDTEVPGKCQGTSTSTSTAKKSQESSRTGATASPPPSENGNGGRGLRPIRDALDIEGLRRQAELRNGQADLGVHGSGLRRAASNDLGQLPIAADSESPVRSRSESGLRRAAS